MPNRSEEIKAALEEIRAKHKGKLTPRDVVLAARNKKSALYREFIWNDAKAAEHQRIQRARELIVRYVTVTVVDRSVKITSPFYVRDPAAEVNVSSFVPLTSESIDRNGAIKIITDEIDRCEAAITRARNIAGVLETKHTGIVVMLESMLENLVDIRRRLAA